MHVYTAGDHHVEIDGIYSFIKTDAFIQYPVKV
jgi:hypothetical protein